MSDGLPDLLRGLRPVSLTEMDERAALLRRVDRKYAVDPHRFADVLERLADDHAVLEIDGRRQFAYRNDYFDTSALRCFTDHVEDRVPRFKVRTRLYEDTGECAFEVKLKRGDGETDKRQLDYDPENAGRLTDDAVACVREALADVGLELGERLAPTLRTAFRRITLVARDSAERLTCDIGIRLSGSGDRTAEIRDGTVLVEAKTESGSSPTEAALAALGLEPISLSKYRVGIALVGEAELDRPQPGSQLFRS